MIRIASSRPIVAAVAAASLCLAALVPAPVEAQTVEEIRDGLHHAATTPGGNPVKGYDAFTTPPYPKSSSTDQAKSCANSLPRTC